MKETMTKRFFAPIWKCDKIESELSRLEQEGWRLDKISGLRKFEFAKATPKSATYFFTYRTRNRNMYDYEACLKREYSALPVKGIFIESDRTRIYRITKNVDLHQYKASRNFFLRYLVLQYVWLALFLFTIAIVGFMLSNTVADFIASSLIAIIGTILFFPNFFGWIYLRKQYPKYQKIKQE